MAYDTKTMLIGQRNFSHIVPLVEIKIRHLEAATIKTQQIWVGVMVQLKLIEEEFVDLHNSVASEF
jgi:hypothetical protein